MGDGRRRAKFNMTVGFPPGATEDSPIFVISVAAELSGLHAQTLRSYDRHRPACTGTHLQAHPAGRPGGLERTHDH